MSVELQNIHPVYDDKPVYDNQAYDRSVDSNENDTHQRGSKRSSSYTLDGGGGRVESSTDDLTDEPKGCMGGLQRMQDGLDKFYENNERVIWILIKILLVVLYFAYFVWAMYTERLVGEPSIRLCWVTCVVVLGVLFYWINKMWGEQISEGLACCCDPIKRNSELVSWIAVGLVFLFVLIFIIVDVVVISKKPYNLISAVGMLVYILLMWIFSKHPGRVKWRPVAWGLAIQFILALLILRWDGGYSAFTWLGTRVEEFLAHTDAGSQFVFGDAYMNHFFALKVLPVVVFFSSFISIMFYLGAMQAVIKVIAGGMQALMGTTAAESMNAAGNIFIGQSEAPLMIKPLLPHMTKSEIHAVMTGGFATIAGTVLAAYISFGVPANHLITASVMSAPAALAISKLFYPETEQSKTTAEDVRNMPKGPERNIIEAASTGASTAISLVANIAANLIAFIALLHFINSALCWFADRVGYDLSPDCQVVETIFSYILWPLSFVMGVDVADCRKVARLIGIKTVVNEFVAYEDLGKMIANTAIMNLWMSFNGTVDIHYEEALLYGSVTIPSAESMTTDFTTWMTGAFPGAVSTFPATVMANVNGTVLAGSVMTSRSIVIATYSLCGFANVGSIGIMLGALSAMAPERKPDISAVVIRAMIAGNVACFMTACIAGLLYQGE